MWKEYNYGPVNDMSFYDKNGEPFSGTMPEWLALYDNLISGIKNTISGKVMLLDFEGNIIAKGA